MLTAIGISAYDAMRENAISVSLQSDAASAYKSLKSFRIDNGNYPVTINCNQPDSTTNKCVQLSDSKTTYQYDYNNNTDPQTFGLTVTNKDISFRIVNDSPPVPCAPGFIVVPGSPTYGTKDFCVMKYEAKRDGATAIPISQASGLPWDDGIVQSEAIANSSRVNGCTGCHLITEVEWLTIAQNVASVSGNWNNGEVGSDYIYSGHNDGEPATILAASSDDNDGYYGETNKGGNQKRTLTLTNGEVIWDLAGNVNEWTTGVIASGQQPGVIGDTGYVSREWTDITAPLQNGLPSNVMPGYTGIAGASGWHSCQGIGNIESYRNELIEVGIVRGGEWDDENWVGVFAMRFDRGGTRGFRVAR